MVAREQHLVPVWEDREPLEEIKYSCLGALHREVPAVHEDIRLREVPQAAVYPVGIGQIKDLQFHGAKLINSRGMNPPPTYLRVSSGTFVHASPEVLFLACFGRPDVMSRRLFSCYRHYYGNLTSGNIDLTLSKAYSIRKANS